MSYYALIPAAGIGSRMSAASTAPIAKQYLSLAGHPMIWHSISTLCSVEQIARVFVVLSPDDQSWPQAEMAMLEGKFDVLRCGGATRAESVRNGLRAMAGKVQTDDWIMVHDAARPCLTTAHILSLIAGVGDDSDSAGGLLAIPLADTLKRASERDLERRQFPRVAVTVPREALWQAQTPQMFRHRVLLDALDFAPQVTDEASAVEALGLRPRLIEADASNFKVTYPFDLDLAELILGRRAVK